MKRSGGTREEYTKGKEGCGVHFWPLDNKGHHAHRLLFLLDEIG